MAVSSIVSDSIREENNAQHHLPSLTILFYAAAYYRLYRFPSRIAFPVIHDTSACNAFTSLVNPNYMCQILTPVQSASRIVSLQIQLPSFVIHDRFPIRQCLLILPSIFFSSIVNLTFINFQIKYSIPRKNKGCFFFTIVGFRAKNSYLN